MGEKCTECGRKNCVEDRCIINSLAKENTKLKLLNQTLGGALSDQTLDSKYLSTSCLRAILQVEPTQDAPIKVERSSDHLSVLVAITDDETAEIVLSKEGYALLMVEPPAKAEKTDD